MSKASDLIDRYLGEAKEFAALAKKHKGTPTRGEDGSEAYVFPSGKAAENFVNKLPKKRQERAFLRDSSKGRVRVDIAPAKKESQR